MAETAPVVLYAEFEALDDRVDEVQSLVEALTADVRAEPGNLEFRAHRERAEASRFFVYERYRDEDAFREHLASTHGRVFNDALRPLVVGGVSRVTFLDGLRPPVS